MSGRGRKQPNRKSRARTSQPSAKKKPPPTQGPSPARSAHAGAAAQSRPEPDGLKGLGTSGSRAVAPPRSAASARRPSSAGAGSSRPPNRSSRADRRKRNQKIGVIVGALALAGALVGRIIAGQAGDPAPASSTGATASPGVEAVTPTTPASATPPVAGSPAAGSPAPAPPAPDPAAAASAAGLAMTMTCPSGAGASPRFEHDITAPTPYEVTIDYGDGDVYTDTSDRLGAIFSHTYAEPGTYPVSAVLTDPTGRTTTAACTYTWSQ